MIRFALAFALLACCVEQAAAQRVTIPFPEQTKPAPPLPPPEAVSRGVAPGARTPAGRTKFAEQLAASFNSAGFSVRVSAQESGADARGFPKLLIAGLFDDAFLYRMKTTGRFLDPAMKTGFRSVEINAQISRARIVYDLAGGSVPRCDTQGRICD